MCAGVVVCAGIVAVLSSAFVAGVTNGSLGQALKAGILKQSPLWRLSAARFLLDRFPDTANSFPVL
jgi:hypothetical protein